MARLRRLRLKITIFSLEGLQGNSLYADERADDAVGIESTGEAAKRDGWHGRVLCARKRAHSYPLCIDHIPTTLR